MESKRHTKDWGLRLGEKITRPFKKGKGSKAQRRSFVDDEATAPLLSHPGSMPRETSAAIPTAPPSASEVFNSQTVINLISYTFLALHSVAYDQVLPVFLNYPRQTPDSNNTHLPFYFSGGFGLTSEKIGSIFTVYGIVCGFVQFFLFPPLCSRFGVLNCFRAASKSLLPWQHVTRRR